jgi:ligand-binding sensor domain-containing protein/DNA-binding CsgD family transcriptional regulator
MLKPMLGLFLTSISLQLAGISDSLNITNFGNLYVSNFSPEEYQAGKQNWGICEGENGLIYVANGPLIEGGSEFWEMHNLPSNHYARSVYSLKDGRILVGANEEIGVFERFNEPGNTSYLSLTHKIDESFKPFGSVWQIEQFEDAYYFRAGRGIFKYNKDTIVNIIYGDITDYFTFLSGRMLILVAGKGLGTVEKGSFTLLPYGRYFADKRIVSITPSDSDSSFHIFTDDEGIYTGTFRKLSGQTDWDIDEITGSQISSAIRLNYQYFAIGTVRNGLYIIDKSGNIVQHLNIKNGLQNNTIIDMHPDQKGNLWLSLDYGFSCVFLNSCLSIINTELDMGTGYVSRAFKDKLYFGTNQGLFYMDWEDKQNSGKKNLEIKPVKEITGQVWGLTIIDDVLYCNHHKGLFQVKGERALLVSPLEGSWLIQPLYSNPDYLIQSTYRGFFLYRKTGSGLNLEGKIDGMEDSRSFQQDQNGYLWSVVPNHKLIRYRLDPQTRRIIEKKIFEQGDKIDFLRIRIVGNRRQPIFATEKGLFQYNYQTNEFEPIAFYNEFLNPSDDISEFFEDDFNRIWYVSNNEIGYFSLHLGQLSKVSRPFSLVSRSYTYYFGEINVADRNNILFGVDRGFYHYNADCYSRAEKEYKSYIIDLKTYAEPREYKLNSEGLRYPVYAHNKNSFEFMLTSNILESKERVFYEFMLEGYDDDWSEWTSRNIKEYTNLKEGNYTFRAKARDASGLESSESSFVFQVLPPPWRSLWAYLVYAFIFLLFSFILRRYRLKKLEIEKQKIEQKKQSEIEERKKKYEEEQIKSKQKITELVNERLHQDLRHKSKELSNSMINILHKNEIMLNLKKEMQNLYLEKNLNKRDYNIKRLMRIIENEISTKKDLEVFDSNFNAVHEEFIKNLKEKYPTLNQNDHRLCTFIKMNKSTKEIATFLNMSIRGVETSRYRLRKKMNLASEENLYDIISDI